MSTRAQTNGKPKELNDAQLRPYEENADAESNQDIESEDETQGSTIWGPAVGYYQFDTMCSLTSGLFTEEKLPPLNFHVHYTATGKLKAEDYDATGKAILLRACHDFEAKVIGLNFFPTLTTRARWAEEAFCHVRGDLIKWTHTKVQTVFGFNADKGKKYNKKIYQSLSAHNFSVFLYKDPDLLTGYAENPLITTFISYIFTTRIGRLHESYFNPVSLNMLSGFFSVIRFAIAEWSTGECIQSPPKFMEVDNNPIMMRYLQDLEKWASMNKTFTDKFRSRMNKVYKTQESTHLLHITGSIETSVRLELELRTRDTESEADGMDEDSDDSEHDNLAPVGLSSAGVSRNPFTASSGDGAIYLYMKYWVISQEVVLMSTYTMGTMSTAQEAMENYVRGLVYLTIIATGAIYNYRGLSVFPDVFMEKLHQGAAAETDA
ncbi:hypothetical protein EV359DRAFT_63659 [Lentinula novae-zelandiae]|nr:hypothetical protein EV359DRAFT_63659 [Lentinula novae-zelandiae]